jgi:hypothetical protein
VDAGSSPGDAFANCDDDCMLSLCNDAMAVLWSRVSSTPQAVVPWEITGASGAQIDAEARPTSVSGNWVGNLALSAPSGDPAGVSQDVRIQGPFAGSLPD